MMGGQLCVRSELGKGSTFWFTLNLPVTDALETAKVKNAPAMIGYSCVRKGEIISQGLKALVVDDRRENRLIIVRLLESLGFQMYEAQNGAEGLQQAVAIHPDLVFTDLLMPVLDGFELTRQLRQLPEFQTTPIIAASASVFDHHQQESFAAGCNAFIAKPMSMPLLFELIQQCLSDFSWISETPAALSRSDEMAVKTAQEPSTLSSEQARRLYHLSQMGDIGGVFVEIEQLQHIPELTPLVTQIHFLANNFKLEQISELVEPYIKNPAES